MIVYHGSKPLMGASLELSRGYKCEEQLIDNNSDELCHFKPIENQQYFIRTSDKTIYIFTNKPIEIDAVAKKKQNYRKR